MELIRNAVPADAEALTAIEAACFPAAEAATREEFAARLAVYPNHFWVMEEDGRIVAFVNGMVTDEPTIRDEMFADVSLHNEKGAWQAIFGVNTLPEYRRQGRAARLLNRAADDARAQGRKGCILTCKDRLVHYYASLGYASEGVSASVHGGAVWYDMRLTF
ncbi:GNAT family N-acetyltransferase [Dysosmobacter sp.]|uniref:GNAT family N-acetyltransferase n=1 Tax=Dysosmobacter sp. TaxID=2591382 RepID=UPI002A888493|nr:GNAT family N-acetyltransferase [Dysosmobacter sp.]MDY3281406.1 GNAT family N-acetyltransferase [Dysosmobacter sp.]